MDRCILCLGPNITTLSLHERKTCETYLIHETCETRWKSYFDSECIVCRNHVCIHEEHNTYVPIDEDPTDAFAVPYENARVHRYPSTFPQLNFSHMCSRKTCVGFCMLGIFLVGIFIVISLYVWKNHVL